MEAMEDKLRSVLMGTAGPAFTWCRTGAARLADRRHGIETEGDVRLDELGLAAKNRVSYTPSHWLTLPRILARREVAPQDVFVDFGSGKGRVVYQAARRYSFGRVIGVEISEHLNSMARANIDRNRLRLRCQEVELVTSDVLDYKIPDDVTVAYFYNPFRGDVFSAVIAGLLRSLDTHPRPLRVIYHRWEEEDRLLATGRFEMIRSARGLRPGRRWSEERSIRMYAVTGPGSH
jgi:hypothetical protein